MCDTSGCVECLDDNDCAEGQECNNNTCEATPICDPVCTAEQRCYAPEAGGTDCCELNNYFSSAVDCNSCKALFTNPNCTCADVGMGAWVCEEDGSGSSSGGGNSGQCCESNGFSCETVFWWKFQSVQIQKHNPKTHLEKTSTEIQLYEVLRADC